MKPNCGHLLILSLLLLGLMVEKSFAQRESNITAAINGTLETIRSRCLTALMSGLDSANSTLVSSGGLFSPLFNLFNQLRATVIGSINSMSNSMSLPLTTSVRNQIPNPISNPLTDSISNSIANPNSNPIRNLFPGLNPLG